MHCVPLGRQGFAKSLKPVQVLAGPSRGRNERALSLMAHDQTFLLKVSERLPNRDTAHAMRCGQLAFRGLFFVRREHAIKNARPQAIAQLCI